MISSSEEPLQKMSQTYSSAIILAPSYSTLKIKVRSLKGRCHYYMNTVLQLSSSQYSHPSRNESASPTMSATFQDLPAELLILIQQASVSFFDLWSLRSASSRCYRVFKENETRILSAAQQNHSSYGNSMPAWATRYRDHLGLDFIFYHRHDANTYSELTCANINKKYDYYLVSDWVKCTQLFEPPCHSQRDKGDNYIAAMLMECIGEISDIYKAISKMKDFAKELKRESEESEDDEDKANSESSFDLSGSEEEEPRHECCREYTLRAW